MRRTSIRIPYATARERAAKFNWREKVLAYVQAPLSTPDRWEHRVTAGDDDKGMILRYAFAPRSEPCLLHGFGFESGVDDLEQAIAAQVRSG